MSVLAHNVAAADSLRSDEVNNQAIAEEARITGRIRVGAWLFLVLAAGIETILVRHAMQDDGVNYLDLGDAILRHDWKMAVNGVWSPLYPFLQALALRIVKPTPYAQFTVVHCVNFLIYLFTLCCFEFLLSTAIANRRLAQEEATSSLPPWTLFAVGYAVFMWSTFNLITFRIVTPDMLMAGFVYLAAGLLLQIWQRKPTLVRFLMLGFVLGVGYLAKTPVFLLAFVFFTLAWFFSKGRRHARAGVLAGLVVFLAIGSVWFVPLSKAKGRFTFGDSGRFNYEVHVDEISAEWFFQDLGIAGGRYLHPVRRIFDAPPIYDFSRPIKATSAVSYDPSYWAEGAIPRVTIKRELATIRHWVEFYVDVLFSWQSGLFVGLVVLCFVGGREQALSQVSACWPIWLLGFAGLALYALVYVELRYLAVFFSLVWTGFYCSLRIPPGRVGRSTVAALVIAVVITTAGPSILSVVGETRQLRTDPPHTFWRIARDLQNLGVKPGDRVARLPGHFGLAWGRLLGVTEVVRVPETRAADFWCAKPDARAMAMEGLRELNVTVFVAEQPPPTQFCAPGQDWHRVGDDAHFAFLLKSSK